MKPSDFKDVPLTDKIKSSHYYLYEIAYEDQKKRKNLPPWDVRRKIRHALDNHYCVSFIECPFVFNFASFLSHFEWFAKFLYFNFSETEMRLNIYRNLDQAVLENEAIDTLIRYLKLYPEAYSYPLDQYEGIIKFTLLKRYNLWTEPLDVFREMVRVDRANRKMLLIHLKRLNGGRKERPLPATSPTGKPVKKKYESNAYGYLKLNDDLCNPEGKRQVVAIFRDLFEDLFIEKYTDEDVAAIFFEKNSNALALDFSQKGQSTIDPQKLHWFFRKLKEHKIIQASWKTVREKLIAYDGSGRIAESVYGISKGKIPVSKRRYIERELQPLTSLLEK